MSAAPAPLAVALSSGQMKIVIVALVALAVGMVAATLMVVLGNKDESVVERLERYSVPGTTVVDHDVVAETQLVQQAVDITARIAGRTGVLGWLENALEQTDLPVRAPEALFFYLAGVGLAFLFLLIVLPSFITVVILTAVLALAPPAVLSRAKSKRKQQFEEQLAPTLQLLAGALRSGFSFLQALEATTSEAIDPMKRELNRVLTETRLGRSLEDSLDDCAVRIGSLDLAWAVMAIRIQREVGGNLAELLDNISETMAQRERLRNEIKALTAEGRFSGIIVGLMPIAFGAVLFSMNPGFMKSFTEDLVGMIVLGVTFLFSGLGYLWIRKIMNIEV
ncbi:MAG: type II secretion system F family protein [Acidimicrobiia bacterium]